MRVEPSPSRNNTYRGKPEPKPHILFHTVPVSVHVLYILSQLVCYKSIWVAKRCLVAGRRRGKDDRADRVLSFFSNRRNWDSPNPSPAGESSVPPSRILYLAPLGNMVLVRGGRGRGVTSPAPPLILPFQHQAHGQINHLFFSSDISID
jgi:hypothetical protein